MKQATKAKLLKFFRVTHGWLGVIVFPWIFVIGLTGLYLNHKSLVLDWIGSSAYDESQFADWPVQDVTVTQALAIAKTYWPNEDVQSLKDDTYHDHDSFIFKKDSGRIIITQDTGHYFVKTNLTRRTFAPDGTLLHKKIYWASVFKWLHVRGWLNSDLGTWLADITAVAMVFFSLSGLWLFFAPRLKKIARGFKKLTPAKRPRQDTERPSKATS
ncbi:MAG: hypothetical protein GQ535_17505 [Rhodobacteraceae bacterium]|nr:hypothetical protein [Paracoccaceae bacterium]